MFRLCFWAAVGGWWALGCVFVFWGGGGWRSEVPPVHPEEWNDSPRGTTPADVIRRSSAVLTPHYCVVTVEVPQQFAVSGGTAACSALLSQTVSVNVPSSSHQNFLSSSCQPAETDRCGQMWKCAETDEQKPQKTDRIISKNLFGVQFVGLQVFFCQLQADRDPEHSATWWTAGTVTGLIQNWNLIGAKSCWSCL